MSTRTPDREGARMIPYALLTLLLTVVHHAYGAVRYATPFRAHGAAVALALAGLLVVLARPRRASRGRGGQLAGWAAAHLVLLVPVLAVGAFEGLYNHVLKVALFLGGAPAELLRALFPPPTYELPDDVLFEVTGVLQVVPAALAAAAWPRFVRALRGTDAARDVAGLPRTG
ncbi:MAG TPA: hypothetical protein VEB43_08620 [Anaeromyxobacter sp.]|nr:hypothetical protein [Anaeromyxobacter sp.]